MQPSHAWQRHHHRTYNLTALPKQHVQAEIREREKTVQSIRQAHRSVAVTMPAAYTASCNPMMQSSVVPSHGFILQPTCKATHLWQLRLHTPSDCLRPPWPQWWLQSWHALCLQPHVLSCPFQIQAHHPLQHTRSAAAGPLHAHMTKDLRGLLNICRRLTTTALVAVLTRSAYSHTCHPASNAIYTMLSSILAPERLCHCMHTWHELFRGLSCQMTVQPLQFIIAQESCAIQHVCKQVKQSRQGHFTPGRCITYNTAPITWQACFSRPRGFGNC